MPPTWRGFIDRWRDRRDRNRTTIIGRGTARLQPEDRATVVDGHTRTFWSRGAMAPSTLVQIDGVSHRRTPTSQRVAEMMASRNVAVRPRGNPAFSEAVFVELMRAQRYDRAFACLAPECQRAWGSCEAFADAHRNGALTTLRGVDVTESRILDSWTDDVRGTAYETVAELEVEYAFGSETDPSIVHRVVHLVAAEGKWQSLCFPPIDGRP